MKKHYRQLLKRGEKVANALTTEFDGLEKGLSMAMLPPSRRVLLQRVLEQIRSDIADAKRVVEYAGDRVFHGKKLTSSDDWDSEVHRDARRNRSAVESLMFTIKYGFAFGELGRRGIDAVRDELLEKVLAYNCCRIILMKKRRREELARAA